MANTRQSLRCSSLEMDGILPSLPPEVLLNIALLLRRLDYVMLSSTCRSLRDVLHSETGWNGRMSRFPRARGLAIADFDRLFARIKAHRRRHARMQGLVKLFLVNGDHGGAACSPTRIAVMGRHDRQWLMAAFDYFWNDDGGALVLTDSVRWWQDHAGGRSFEAQAKYCSSKADDERCLILDMAAQATPSGIDQKKWIGGFFDKSTPWDIAAAEMRRSDAVIVLPTFKNDEGELLRLWRTPAGHSWYLSWAGIESEEEIKTKDFAMHLGHLTKAMRKEKTNDFAIMLHKEAPYSPCIVPKHPGLHKMAFAEDVF